MVCPLTGAYTGVGCQNPTFWVPPKPHKEGKTLGKTSKFPHTNHKRSSVRSHTLAPTTICDLSHSLCWSLLTDLGHISSVTYVCHPLWFVCGHRKGILTSPLTCVCTITHVLEVNSNLDPPFLKSYIKHFE